MSNLPLAAAVKRAVSWTAISECVGDSKSWLHVGSNDNARVYRSPRIQVQPCRETQIPRSTAINNCLSPLVLPPYEIESCELKIFFVSLWVGERRRTETLKLFLNGQMDVAFCRCGIRQKNSLKFLGGDPWVPSIFGIGKRFRIKRAFFDLRVPSCFSAIHFALSSMIRRCPPFNADTS